MATSFARRNKCVKTDNQAAAGETLRELFDAALAAADPSQALEGRIPAPVRGRTVVVGAGKASAAMARAFEAAWPGPLEGLVITRYGHAVPCGRIEVVEAGHPVPDAAGEQAARRILTLARGLGPEDQLVFLASGGGSALLSLPAPQITLADKQAVTHALLRSGATITEINTVRKHLSAIKGGRLATAAAPARIVTLAISDVPGDDPAVIASGPTVPDPTTFADARSVLAKHRITEPEAVITRLAGHAEETPKPGDPIFDRARFDLIASPQRSLQAAAAAAERRQIIPILLSDRIEGEARQVALVHAAIAFQVRAGKFRVGGHLVSPPAVILSGGETTVAVTGAGRGIPSSCWRSQLRSIAPRVSGPSPATPMALMERKTMPERSFTPAPWNVPRREASRHRRRSRLMTDTASSPLSAISS
jgi:glycerate 2-kinase